MSKANLESVISDLRSSLAWMDLVLAKLSEGVLVIGEDSIIIFANDAAARLLHKPRILILGLPIWQALPLESEGELHPAQYFTDALASADSKTLNGLYKVRQNTTVIDVNVSAESIPNLQQTVIVVRDITRQKSDESALKQQNNIIELHRQVAAAANESDSLERAIRTTLEIICRRTNWPLGHAYVITEEQPEQLNSTQLWYAESLGRFGHFRKITEQTQLKKGKGLPGRVLESSMPAWIEDIATDINFMRRDAATAVGIKSGCAFPILVKEEVVAVLELFSAEKAKPNHALLETMKYLGAQLGRVVERQRSERDRIELFQKRISTVIEHSPLSIQILSPDGTTLHVNKAWEKLWGAKLSQLKGYNLLKDDQLQRKGTLKYVKRGFKGKPTIIPAIKYEPRQTLPNVEAVDHRWVRGFIYPVKDEKGRIQEVILMHEDVSEQVKANEAIERSEERFRTLIEQSTDAIQLVSPEGEILYTSESIRNVLGYTPDDLKGAGVGPYLHPEDTEYFNTKLQELIRNPTGHISMEYRVKHKEGSWAWIETTGVNHLNTPNISALVGIFRNITERKEAELTLSYQKSLLEAQQEVSPLGILVVGIDGRVVTHNTRFARMWRFSKEDLQGDVDQGLLEAVAKDLIDGDEFLRQAEAIYKDGVASNSELHFKDGRIFDRFGSPVVGDDGTNFGYVWFFLDITERKQLERQKDDFIGIATHELKTPVTSIKAYTQTLQRVFENQGDKQASNKLLKINSQLDRLTNLIGDLLDASKIEAGRLQFLEKPFDFDEFVHSTVETMQHSSTRHRLIVEGIARKTIIGDKDRLEQVLINLITNAIKYSPHSDKVLINVSAKSDHVKLCVQDFGIGIPQESKERVFERFYRVSGPNEATFPGLGLGLYISAEIIKRLGGNIWVESVKGSGSTFCFTLPINVNSTSRRNRAKSVEE